MGRSAIAAFSKESTNMVGISGEEAPGPKKERETKDDGRYIIFYTFLDEEAGENEPFSEEEGATS
jgi:hypothetical protein